MLYVCSVYVCACAWFFPSLFRLVPVDRKNANANANKWKKDHILFPAIAQYIFSTDSRKMVASYGCSNACSVHIFADVDWESTRSYVWCVWLLLIASTLNELKMYWHVVSNDTRLKWGTTWRSGKNASQREWGGKGRGVKVKKYNPFVLGISILND